MENDTISSSRHRYIRRNRSLACSSGNVALGIYQTTTLVNRLPTRKLLPFRVLPRKSASTSSIPGDLSKYSKRSDALHTNPPMQFRVRKNSENDFVLLVASADPSASATTHDFKIGNKDAKLTVQYGDFSSALKRVVAALSEAGLNYTMCPR